MLSNIAFAESKWITKKINNPDETNNKLIKLKEIFDKELITQSEYDKKRKEILGLETTIVSNDKQNVEVIKKISGYYKGNLIYPNGDRLPVYSEIYLNNKNLLEGKYFFFDFGGELLPGKLNEFKIQSNNEVSIDWIDKYGRGWLNVNLYSNKFEGTFGVLNNNQFDKIGNWTGVKISLDEYNYERKEILGLEEIIVANTNKQNIEVINDTTGPKIIVANSFQANQDLTAIIRGTVNDQNEIVLVTIDGDNVSLKQGSFTYPIFVKPNGQIVEIVALDKYGNKSKKTVQLKRSTTVIATKKFDFLDPRKIKVKIKPNAVALIIGVENYENTFAAPFAKNDALFFNDFVHTSLGVPKYNIKLLMNKDARRNNTLKSLFKWLPKVVDENKTDLYIFFSGHGLASEDGKDLFLLPSDGDPEILEETSLHRNIIFDSIAKLNPKSVTVFLDTCYSGATRSEEFLVASKQIFIEPVEQLIPKNFSVFSASAGKETAKVLKEAGHGLFSYYLMKGLEGEADKNNDKQITNEELIGFIKKNVSRQANQTPQLSGNPGQVLVQW